MKQIVVIDDEEQLVELMARAINGKRCETYKAHAFSNPLEAVKWMELGNQFDLVIVDYNMPGLSGIQVAQKVKGLCKNVPVVVSTGDSGNEQELKKDFDYILPKPYKRKFLFHLIDNLLVGEDKKEQ